MNKGAQRDGEAQLGEERTTQNTQHTKAKRAKSVSRVLEARRANSTWNSGSFKKGQGLDAKRPSHIFGRSQGEI